MEFTEITIKEYQKFWENHPLKTFLSSPNISKLREKSGYDISFVGIKKNKKIIAAALLTSKTKLLKKKEFYAPRGFLVDFNDQKIVDFFVKKLKKYIKEQNGFILRIDPYVYYKQRDIDGNIVPDGFDNSEVVKHLMKIGFKQVPEQDFEQVGWMFSLDLKDKTEEEILQEMRPNTRNIIRRSERFGIVIRELKKDELPRFLSIMESTGERRNFSIRNLNYFETMYDLFSKKDEIKYLVTELNLKDYIKKLEDEINEKQTKIDKLSDSSHNDKQKKVLHEDIKVLESKTKKTKDIRKEKNTDTITLSGSMFIMTKPEVTYLSSGNYKEFLSFNSQYLIQWEMIKYGIKNGYEKYNFYGIPADINKKPKDYGIYEFKRGFNGYVEELIGEFELPISNVYYINKMMKKIKSLIKKKKTER